MKAKVALVRGGCETHGLAAALRAVGLARSTWYYQTRTRVSYAEKYAHLEAPLKAIAEAHPEYGYRRATTELRESHGHHVNRKVVERLHRLWDLPLRRARRPKAERDTAGGRRRGSAGEPVVETRQVGDRSAGGHLHGLH